MTKDRILDSIAAGRTDLVFDLRYLPNPHFVPELRPQTGRDAPVAEFVLGEPETEALLGHLVPLLEHVLPRYEREGKAYLTVAIGCTGGRHRSVAIARELGARLAADSDTSIAIVHRDMERGAMMSALSGEQAGGGGAGGSTIGASDTGDAP